MLDSVFSIYFSEIRCALIGQTFIQQFGGSSRKVSLSYSNKSEYGSKICLDNKIYNYAGNIETSVCWRQQGM